MRRAAQEGASGGSIWGKKMTTALRAVVFDLDGTLIHSAPQIWRAANLVLSEAGLPEVSFAQSRDFIGRGARIFVERMERAVAGSNEAARTEHLHARFLHYYEHAHEGTEVYPHVPEMLEAFRAQGLALGLCTNKPMGPTRGMLAYLGWTEVFAYVIGGDSLPVAKPDPAPLLAVLRALDCVPEQVVYIGDSETDAEAAARAGLCFGLFTEGYRKGPVEALAPQFHFSDYRDLPAALAQMRAA
ncbi:MAG: phosphoglycolate phosphatase [Rhodobacteraceae bacterium]|nr:MAG: phosphoglycolate phosphatase [Paracoccaceae bacterium]